MYIRHNVIICYIYTATINGGLFIELRVEELRKQHGLTLSQLSELSGVSKTVLSEIKLKIKRSLNNRQEEGLARAFNCKVEELYKEKVNW